MALRSLLLLVNRQSLSYVARPPAPLHRVPAAAAAPAAFHGMEIPQALPSWAGPFAHLPLDQWPLWARGLLRRTHRRVSGAALISAGCAARDISVPRGQASRSLAEAYGLEAASMLLPMAHRAVLSSALSALASFGDDDPFVAADSAVVLSSAPSPSDVTPLEACEPRTN